MKAFLLSFRQMAAGILMVDQIQICQIKKICPTFSLMDEREREKEGDVLTHAIYGKGLAVLMSSRMFPLQ